MSTPSCSRTDAKWCRSAWNPFSLDSAMPAVRNAGGHCALSKTLLLIAAPRVLVNSSGR